MSRVMESNDSTDVEMVPFMLDGNEVMAFPEETILQVSQRLGQKIPHLCYTEGLRGDGNCRACVVEIDGERTLAPSCMRKPAEGMKVNTQNDRVLNSQKMVLELLQSDTSNEVYKIDNELMRWSDFLEVGAPRFTPREFVEADESHPAISVHMESCIQCNRCLRACRDEQVNDVIGYSYRGSKSAITFDFDDSMGNSSCVGCGECVQVCPTGALSNKFGVSEVVPDKQVESVCPYCGVGCQLTYNVKDNKIISVDGRDGPANEGRLCVKGRYGFDYVHHKQRLTKPLIRKDNAPKSADQTIDPNHPESVFREASWEEALELVGKGFKDILAKDGPSALAGLGSAKGSCEEAYLVQKLVRTGFNSNNVDHCTRLCHASSVVALLEGIGSGAVSNPMKDVEKADVIILTGSNPTVNHPVGSSWMKNAIKNGTKLILLDPRRTDIARFATHFLQFKPGSDVAMLNAIMHVIIDEGLTDSHYIENHTENFEALKQHLKSFTPEAMESICGIDPETLRETARLYATANNAMILWGMGVSQHVHGTDNARCLISLCMITGQIGRPGSGLHPLRGQNNVQGSSDVGLIPMVFPDYQPVTSPEAQQRFEKLWGMELDHEPGLTTVEIINHAYDGKVKGMYVQGENPAMSDPDSDHARAGLARLEHLVVQDIFLTETAYFADVILPASAFPEKTGTFINSDRTVQLGRQAIDPPGDAKQDLWIIQEVARSVGLDWTYEGPEEVFEEMRLAMDSIAGISYQRLEDEGFVTYPCTTEDDPGNPVIFTDGYPTESSRAKLVPAAIISPDETPDEEYPLVLITGRQLEHWHTGSMTRRASVLDSLEPSPYVAVNPRDLLKFNLEDGQKIGIESRRGAVSVDIRSDSGIATGTVFMPFCYYEGSANRLTNAALDPFAKIAETKYCAVRITKPVKTDELSSYGGGQALGYMQKAPEV